MYAVTTFTDNLDTDTTLLIATIHMDSLEEAYDTAEKLHYLQSYSVEVRDAEDGELRYLFAR